MDQSSTLVITGGSDPGVERVKYLEKILGFQTVMYILGLRLKELLGPEPPDGATFQNINLRLSHAYEAANLIANAYDAETVASWMFGSNRLLGDRAPAFVLAHAERGSDLANLLPAAKAFVGLAA